MILVTKTSDPQTAPDAGFQVGGIMARSADGDLENHIVVGIGCMGNPNLKMICQNTINGNSAIHVTRTLQNYLHVRLTRTGNNFRVYYFDAVVSQWMLWREIKRDNMPEQLQIGIAAFSYVPGNGPNRKPDLLVHAEHWTITTPSK